jgi:salicylate hydroxylase
LRVLVSGGGIGGMAAAVALARGGHDVRLFEQSLQFSEFGAGVQLGPNATRVLGQWGLGDALARVACAPQRLVVRSADSGAALATMELGADFFERYGAPYLTVHRADLHRLLREAAQAGGAQLLSGRRVTRVSQEPHSVRVHVEGTGAMDEEDEAAALVAADGIWSVLREQVLEDGAARPTGHIAFRALLDISEVPAHLRNEQVNVWLGPRSHTVAYPVRGGQSLNLVVIVEAERDAGQGWDSEGTGDELRQLLGAGCAGLAALTQLPASWRSWSLHDRPPMRSPGEMVHGRVALLGDAAHPMLPYLAQGTAMALEDAAELARVLPGDVADVPAALQTYASNRWQRCARVQQLARRNGEVFHAQGLMRWGRDAALRMLGRRLMDQPWLYGA